ncbi:MAG: hypothetical protein KF800_02895 [Lysobacter sp.]|nr:hypothetical protein [Lysobacter sp.]
MRVRARAGLLLAAGLLLSPPAFAGGQAPVADVAVPETSTFDPARLDLATVGPARLARVDRMLAATGFGTIYDHLFAMFLRKPLPADAAPEVVEERRVRERIAPLISWQATRDLWRAAFAQTLSDEVLDGVTVFHESEAGRAIVACMTSTADMRFMADCQMLDDERHLQANFEFRASPVSRAYEHGSEAMMEPVVRFALRRALERAPDEAAALASMCRRNPGDTLCTALPEAETAR